MKKQKVMLLVNDTTYAYNLRKEVIEKLVAEGYEVVVVCALLLLQEELKALGCRLIGVETGRQGTNPVEDLKLFGQYIKILRKEKPDTVLSYNIKPNVYGGMACRLLGMLIMRIAIGIRFTQMLMNVWPSLLSSVVMATVAVGLKSISDHILYQMFSILICCGVYAVLMCLLPSGRRLLFEIPGVNTVLNRVKIGWIRTK